MQRNRRRKVPNETRHSVLRDATQKKTVDWMGTETFATPIHRKYASGEKNMVKDAVVLL
jgi:hypothetical protein